MISTEKRPWWKLSWPAVVAGLVMLAALAVKNLDGVTYHSIILPYSRGTALAPVDRWRVHFGWPIPFLFDESFLDQRPLLPVLPRSNATFWLSGLVFDLAAVVLVVLGTMQTINRWQRQRVFRFFITIRGMLALMAFIALVSQVIPDREYSERWWSVTTTLATGVLFVGIFLTCFAVIDWIGWGWSVVSRQQTQGREERGQ